MANEKRLIYADALKRQFVDYVRTPPHFHYGDWQNMCIKGTEIDEVIETAPTVDAVEVVHSRAVLAKATNIVCTHKCAICDALIVFNDNYCPNCGAKMDGDGNGKM